MSAVAINTPVYLVVHVKEYGLCSTRTSGRNSSTSAMTDCCLSDNAGELLTGLSYKKQRRNSLSKDQCLLGGGVGTDGKGRVLVPSALLSEVDLTPPPCRVSQTLDDWRCCSSHLARDNVLVARTATCHHPTGSRRVVAQLQGAQRTVMRSTPAYRPKCSAG